MTWFFLAFSGSVCHCTLEVELLLRLHSQSMSQKSHPTCTGPSKPQLLEMIFIKPSEAEGRRMARQDPPLWWQRKMVWREWLLSRSGR